MDSSRASRASVSSKSRLTCNPCGSSSAGNTCWPGRAFWASLTGHTRGTLDSCCSDFARFTRNTSGADRALRALDTSGSCYSCRPSFTYRASLAFRSLGPGFSC